jgi:hypothetical protein
MSNASELLDAALVMLTSADSARANFEMCARPTPTVDCALPAQSCARRGLTLDSRGPPCPAVMLHAVSFHFGARRTRKRVCPSHRSRPDGMPAVGHRPSVHLALNGHWSYINTYPSHVPQIARLSTQTLSHHALPSHRDDHPDTSTADEAYHRQPHGHGLGIAPAVGP